MTDLEKELKEAEEFFKKIDASLDKIDRIEKEAEEFHDSLVKISNSKNLND